jgi:capsular exopolysaccharide synthesis family protein
VSKIFGIPSVPGLTDVILGNYKWRETVRSITDLMMGQMATEELMATPGLDNLFILTSGTIAPNPAELVNTKINQEILKEVHGEYDFVIIDAPPILAATDAVLWGTMADGVIIVYQVGKIARGALKRAKAQLDNVKASVIGVVLNGLKAEISPDYEYHDKYYYYYGSERKKKLTIGERIASLPERVRRFAGAIPGKTKSPAEEPAEAKPQSGSTLLKSLLESKLLKIVLLLLALGLLAAGLYYSWMMTQIIEPPSKPGIAALKPPPPKAPTVPMPVTKPEVTLDPGVLVSSPPQPDSAVSMAKDIPNKAEAPPGVTPDVPEKPFAVQVRATQDDRIARDTVASLKSRGHDAFNEKVDLKGKGIWHRIFIGRFASESEAQKYIETKGLETVYPDFIIRRAPEITRKPSESGNSPPAKVTLPR